MAMSMGVPRREAVASVCAASRLALAVLTPTALPGFGCPKCGHAMQLRTVVMPPATLRVLASLARSARGPP
jgi:predicted RNA-binding Zn-ribbon protein involved in translation (DUF1610 family)